MGYRTYINDIQIFGSNELYPEWIDFIKSIGIEVDEDYDYEADITSNVDFMDILNVCEKIVMRLENERKGKASIYSANLEKLTELEAKEYRKKHYIPSSLFDLSYIYENQFNHIKPISMTDELISIIENGYMFIPYKLIKACENKLEIISNFSTSGHFNCYKINKPIHIKAC